MRSRQQVHESMAHHLPPNAIIRNPNDTRKAAPRLDIVTHPPISFLADTQSLAAAPPTVVPLSDLDGGELTVA